MRVFTLFLLGLVFVSSGTDVCVGQQRVAFTNVQQAGEDYSIQGEYRGFVRFSGLLKSRAGLHVVAGGQGRFTATLLPGGLTGEGWVESKKFDLAGANDQEGVTTLKGDLFTVYVQAGTAVVFNAEGQKCGRLQRVIRQSVTMGMAPPAQAIVLFSGEETDKLQGARLTSDGLLMEGVLTSDLVRDFRLHLEFRTPFMPNSTGQSRGNSGVYIQQRYEIQVLDSFGLAGLHNECGGVYRQRAPSMNMALPPLVWQTYDIYFRAARFSDEREKTENARITVYHNGIAIHTNYELSSKTGAGKPEGPESMPILLQNHSDPVRFRNFWLVHLPLQSESDPR